MAYFYRVTTPAGKVSPFWYVGYDYHDATGKFIRVQRSTKCTLRKDAETVGKAWEDAALKAGKGKLNLEHIRRVMEEMHEHATGEASRRYTVKSWVKEWLGNHSPTVSESSRVRYEQVSDDFLKFLGSRAGLDVEQLRKQDVVDFRDTEREAGKAARTCNQAVKIIRMIFQDAVKERVLGHNPAGAVKPMTEADSVRTPFTVEEVQNLVKAASNDEWRGLILLGFYSGARIGDLSTLRWENVDLANRTLRFVPEKTRKLKPRALVVPMHDVAREFLLGLPSADDPNARVFPGLAAMRVGGRAGLSKGFLGIMDKAGVSAGLTGQRKGKGRRTASRSFHSLRHTFTSEQANAGVSKELRMKLTGHSDEGVHEGYTHHDLPALRKGVDVLPKLTL
jgi:integrase